MPHGLPFIIPAHPSAKEVRDFANQTRSAARGFILIAPPSQGVAGGRFFSESVVRAAFQSSGDFQKLIPEGLPMDRIVQLYDSGLALTAAGYTLAQIGGEFTRLGLYYRGTAGQGVGVYIDHVKDLSAREAVPGSPETQGTQAFLPIRMAMERDASKSHDQQTEVDRALKQGQGDLQKVLEDNQRLRLAVEALTEENRRLRQTSPTGGAPEPALSTGRRHQPR